jgi:hypothetical protein
MAMFYEKNNGFSNSFKETPFSSLRFVFFLFCGNESHNSILILAHADSATKEKMHQLRCKSAIYEKYDTFAIQSCIFFKREQQHHVG